ncbi:MAG TPA: uracil-DNA glycosylase [Pirellulaceae bacterium]
MMRRRMGAIWQRGIAQYARTLRQAGVTHTLVPNGLEAGSPMSEESVPSATADHSPSPSSDRAADLAVIQTEVAACTRCDVLARSRTQTVFGSGSVQPRLCFLGEAPGADEDRQGVPFVGRSGQLLTDIIKACTLRREDVYILNVLKCRPPNNRTPEPAETANCRGYFERQLQILRPEFICCLGLVAAQALLETKVSLGRMRGRFHDWRNSQVVVTYHPSYLLRQPSAKKDTWDDMQMLMRAMGIPIPGET